MIRLWNSIAADFRGDEPVHLPYIEEPGTDNILGRDWARGFMLGTRLAPEGWSRLFQEEAEGQVITIPLIAGEIDPEWPKQSLTEEKGGELLQSMIVGAARAYQYFEPNRRRFANRVHPPVQDGTVQEPYTRSDPKVGRNDLCPCGSGKKFKKCCG